VIGLCCISADEYKVRKEARREAFQKLTGSFDIKEFNVEMVYGKNLSIGIIKRKNKPNRDLAIHTIDESEFIGLQS